MFQLVYVSTASWSMTHGDLNAILDISRANNRRLGVTGMLLHLDHGFLQVLEGPKDAVLHIFSKVERDRRHIGLRVLVQQEVNERLFADWSMGFDRLSESNPRTAGVFKITREAIEHAVAPEKAAQIAVLLRNFYRINAGSCAA
jgi:hypothetical protein